METPRLISTMAPLLAAMGIVSPAAQADIQRFYDKGEWEAAVDQLGDTTTLDFTGFQIGEPLTDQYAHLGATFLSPAWVTVSNGFLNDEWGARSAFDPGLNIAFDEPKHWLAADYLGAAAFRLFRDEVFIEQVEFYSDYDPFDFGGIISDAPFDRVEIVDVTDGAVYIDDVHFGAPVPGPGGMGLLALLCVRQRRRRSGAGSE